MNKLEDLIITFNNNIILTPKYLDYIINEHFLNNRAISINSIDIKHNVLDYHEHYEFNSWFVSIEYIAQKGEIHISYGLGIMRTLKIKINRFLLYVTHEQYDLFPASFRTGPFELTIYFVHIYASTKFCAIHDSRNSKNQIVFINNNRFEIYSGPFILRYDSMIYIINKLKSAYSAQANCRTKIISENQKRSNEPHKQICTSLIHKIDTYALRDCNPIKHIIDFLYPYRY